MNFILDYMMAYINNTSTSLQINGWHHKRNACSCSECCADGVRGNGRERQWRSWRFAGEAQGRRLDEGVLRVCVLATEAQTGFSSFPLKTIAFNSWHFQLAEESFNVTLVKQLDLILFEFAEGKYAIKTTCASDTLYHWIFSYFLF